MIKDWIYAAVGIAGIARAARMVTSSYGTYRSILSPRTYTVYAHSVVYVGGHSYSFRKYYPVRIRCSNATLPPVLQHYLYSRIVPQLPIRWFDNISSSLRWEPAAMLPFLIDSDYTDIASAKLDKATFDMLAERDKYLERVARQLDNTLYYNPFFPASTESSQSLMNSCRSAMTIMHYVKPRRRIK